MKRRPPLTARQKELTAELLRERIYATLALLAVLISLDTTTRSPWHTMLIVGGTIVSLWAASVVATLMSRRVVYQNEIDHHHDREIQLRKHAPMLASLVLPVFLLTLAGTHLISQEVAINASIISALLLLVGWSLLSARAFQATRGATLILAAIELGIGLAVVGLKIILGH